MKRLFLIVFLVFGMSTMAHASKTPECSDGEELTGKTWYHQHCYTDTDTDTHAEQRDQFGVGADVVVWQNETEKVKFIEEVVAEYKYDIENEAHSVYGVVRVNLWSKIKSLFNKGE